MLLHAKKCLSWSFRPQPDVQLRRKTAPRLVAQRRLKTTESKYPVQNPAAIASLLVKANRKINAANEASSYLTKLETITDAEKIFPTSRDLNLNDMEAVGFDYDYTLASYTDNLQPLIYDLAVRYLVNNMGYPHELETLKYDPNFPVRGLYYDNVNGNLLKLDYLYNITPGYVYFGRKALTSQQIIDQYSGLHISPSYQANLRPLVDRFCLPEACLIADLIDYCKKKRVSFDPTYLYNDVFKALNHIHSSGELHNEITSNLPKYLERSNFLGQFLERLRAAGKKIFLLTNSPFPFVDAGMKHLLNESWASYFDVIIAQAGKPEFFLKTRRPFRSLDVDKNHIKWEKVTEFERGKIYVEGNLAEFQKLTKFRGSRVLYFGDHLFADVREPSRISGWRTCIVLEELEHEVRTQASQFYRDTLTEIMMLEDAARRLDLSACKTDSDAIEVGKDIQEAIAERRRVAKTIFNKHFGSVFRTHTSPTIFAYMVQRYADIYTSKMENFDFYPLDFMHHAEREFLPHERSVKWQIMQRMAKNKTSALVSEKYTA